MLLVRAQKEGDYGLLFPQEIVGFDRTWTDAVDFERLVEDVDSASVAKEETEGNEDSWTIAFTRSPALYNQLMGGEMVVVVKAKVVV